MFPLTEKRNNLRGAAGFQSRSESWEMRCGRFDVCVVSFLLFVSRCSSLSLLRTETAACLLRSEHVRPAPTQMTQNHNRTFRVITHRFSRHISWPRPADGDTCRCLPVAVHLSPPWCQRVGNVSRARARPGENTWEDLRGAKRPEDKRNRTTWIYWTQDRSSARDRWVRTCNTNRRDVTACTGLSVSPEIKNRNQTEKIWTVCKR